MGLHKKSFYLLFFLVIFAPAFVHCSGKKGFSLSDRGPAQDIAPCLTLLKKKKNEDAIKCLETYKSRSTVSSESATADLGIADAYFNNKEYIVAAEAYNLFTQTYPAHVQTPYAYFRSGLSYYKQSPKSIDRDFGDLESSLKMFQVVTTYYNHTPFAAEARKYHEQARQKMARKHFYVGRFYYHYNEYLAAIPRFQAIVNDYQNVGLEEKTYYYLIKSLKETKQNDLAKSYFEIFKEFYPDKKNAIQKMARLF